MALTISAADQQNGGGIVITVSGSSGFPISIYSQATDESEWTLFDTILADGNSSGTLDPGKTYWFYAIEDDTISNIISSVVTRDNESVLERVLAAVQAQLQVVANANGFPGDGTAVFPAITSGQIVRQKEFDPVTIESIYPAIVVVYGGNESQAEEMTQTDDIIYPVQIHICDTVDKTDVSHDKYYTFWREQISRKFRHQRLSGVTECRTVQITYNEIFTYLQMQYAQLKSSIQLSVICRETRGV